MKSKFTEKDYNFALEIATEAHKGQMRWNGEDYITHPKRIADKINNWHLKIIAILHDVLEDTDVTLIQLKNRFPEDVTIPLQLLTHNKEDNYANYIYKIKHKNLGSGNTMRNRVYNLYAVMIKCFDLRDNSKDLKEKDKQRSDKYGLALLYLGE